MLFRACGDAFRWLRHLAFAKAAHQDLPLIPAINQVLAHSIGAGHGQIEIVGFATLRVGVPVKLDPGRRMGQHVIQQGLRKDVALLIKLRAVVFEGNRQRRFLDDEAAIARAEQLTIGLSGGHQIVR
jgi:hypothetical protein